MARFLIQRILSGLLALYLFATALFFGIQLALPGDYVSQFTLGLTSEEAAQARHDLGLDQPLVARYFVWMGNLLHGDLGRSYSVFGRESGTPVVDILIEALPATILLFGVGTALAFLLGQWLGKLAAWRGRGLLTSSATFASIMLYTSFPPWLAFLLMFIITIKLGIPLGQGLRTRYDFSLVNTLSGDLLWHMIGWLVVVVATLLIANWIVTRLRHRGIRPWLFVLLAAGLWAATWRIIGWDDAIEAAKLAFVPLLTFTALSFGEIMLIMRTNMTDTLHEEYIQTARAKGLKPRDIRDRHAARNALLPVISRLVISLPYLLTGMVMLEQIFNWEGVGTVLFYAIGMQNVPLGIGAMLLIGVFSLSARLLLDVLVAVLDPRIRYAS